MGVIYQCSCIKKASLSFLSSFLHPKWNCVIVIAGITHFTAPHIMMSSSDLEQTDLSLWQRKVLMTQVLFILSHSKRDTQRTFSSLLFHPSVMPITKSSCHRTSVLICSSIIIKYPAVASTSQHLLNMRWTGLGWRLKLLHNYEVILNTLFQITSWRYNLHDHHLCRT